MKVSPKVTSIERVTALITQMNFLNNIQKRRMVLPFFIAIIALIMGVLVISSISLLIRSHIEFQPLLERARTIMDGTADPTPSEELVVSWHLSSCHHTNHILITESQYKKNEP